MGSLSSRPSVPSQPQVVYMPQAVSSPTATQTTSSKSEVISDKSESASETRSESLLRRNRGRLGTIKTGFSGLLSSIDSSAQRKTLLGE